MNITGEVVGYIDRARDEQVHAIILLRTPKRILVTERIINLAIEGWTHDEGGIHGNGTTAD